MSNASNADPRPTLEAPDDDPWIWLEDIDSPQATAWADAQTAKTLERFGDAGYLQDRGRLAAIYDQPANIPFVARRGDKLFNFWKDAEHPRGLWRTTTLESYRTDNPDWEILLDLDALAEAEGEDWIWGVPVTFPGSHDRAILSLSRGGGDATVLREFDLTTRTFIPDGFQLPEAKTGVAWLDRDTLLLRSAYGPGMATRSGYCRTIRLWQRGTDPLTAPVIFEIAEDSMGAWVNVDREAAEETIWFIDRIAFFDVRYWIGERTGAKTLINVPTDVSAGASRGWLAAKPRFPWTVGGKTFAPDSVLVIRLDDFLAGARDFTTLFEPAERRALEGFFMREGRVTLSILDDLRPVFETWTPPDPAAGGDWRMSRITGLPDLGVANVWPLDVEGAESNGDMLAKAQDPLTPQTLFLIKSGGTPEPLKHAPTAFNPSGLVITRHEAVSEDGTRIPYTQVGPAGTVGDAPVHLYAYGGFGISQLPAYNSAIGKLWLERGGTSVVANIRGGGEFGTAWHEAGRREGKRLSHDDFAAVAADLVRRGVTRPERLAAEGGSNGGILISNMLTRYPERFGALFCTIPLIDMRRYTKLLAGASWMAEYGDPDDPADWAFLGPMSAYHTAVPGQHYPPILLATTRRDDRVHPGHARKMAAKLQALGYEAYFYEPAAGGHGYGKDNTERAGFTALGYSFLRSRIGWEGV
jgi:prolyl oligopeptidase